MSFCFQIHKVKSGLRRINLGERCERWLLERRENMYKKKALYILLGLLVLILVGCGQPDQAEVPAEGSGEPAQSTEPTEPAAPTYVGSETCKTCHSDKYAGWQRTLHSKMIQDASGEGVVIGDFSNIPEEFADVADVMNPDDIVYTIGSKWKQRYLVEGEDGFHYILPLQWNTAKEQWQPYHKDDWSERPWEKKCAGCHATGLNVTDYSFVEPAIGCEACHGPGSEHAKTADPTKIVATVAVDVCASCHNRGVAPSGEGYPVGFQPGEELGEEHYTSVAVGDKHVWDNGWAKGHHQQYLDWLLSGHSTALESLMESGHVRDYCLNCHSADYRLAPEDAKPAPEELTESVNCNVCHVTHEPGFGEAQLRLPREEVCSTCHNAGGPVEAGQAVHHPQAEMLSGEGALEVASVPSLHQAAGITCVDCHMTKVAKSMNYWDISNHVFQPVLPGEALEGMPDTCTSCHKGSDPADRQAIIDSWQTTIENMLAELEPRLEAAKARVDAGGLAEDVVQLYNIAFTNVSFVKADASKGVHNFAYTKAVLEAAAEKLDAFEERVK